MTEDAANQTGLNQLGVQGTESELAGLYDEAQWRIAMETLKTMAGVHFLSLSSIIAREGEEVEMSMTTDTGAADTYKLKITQLTVPEDRAVDLYFRAQVQPRARPSNLESQGTAGQ